jgi:hypothetical protein
MKRWRAEGIEINGCGITAGDVLTIFLTTLDPAWVDTLRRAYGEDVSFQQSGPFTLVRT